ncbi:polysaccharide biosynthesis tyrosine autokinase [Occallatibacter riparius]|uniref:non-specific protein-tyrosine kinase n=2 Tax=Occallatibacter riparius TaxID=1002689 RepID=A0A9J7BX32_9BACT|nr:polysaccharide biosynthesis tyrosine autokinase [Occallatibacter riparius]
MPPASRLLPQQVGLSPATFAASEEPKAAASFDIFEPLRVIWRRRLCLYISIPAVFILAVATSFLMPAKYTATSRLQLVTQQTGQLSVGDPTSANAAVFDSFATLQTDVTLMESDSLALQVIKELNLADTKEFAFKPRLNTAEARRQMALPLEQSPLKRAEILAKYKKGLKVDILPGARLISVSYSSSNPEMAAAIVNKLVNDFVDYDIRGRYDATIRATTFLRRQLVELKSEVETSQQRVVDLQKESGMFSADKGQTIVESGLEQLNKDVITAEGNRVTKQAIYNMARTGDVEAMANLVGTSGVGGGAQQPQNWTPLITHLKQQMDDLNVQYAQAATEYGSAHPKLIELKEKKQALEATIQSELANITKSAKSDYELALSQEQATRRKMVEQEALASQMNDRAIAYNIAKNEADSSRTLYEALLQKLKEAEVLAGLRSSGLNVVDPAAVPGSPAKPALRVFMAGGLAGGIVIGILLAFLLESTDHRLRTLLEIETAAQGPLLGVIPQDQLSRASQASRVLKAYGTSSATRLLPAAVDEPEEEAHDIAEAFRWVRTSLVMRGGGGIPRTLMIASASANEGKSFTALNLAGVLTENRNKVLLVDADLRRANLSRILNRESEIGLSETLRGVTVGSPMVQIESIAGLTFLPAGAILKSPAELLSSTKMLRLLEEWRRDFNYVVIDTPPLLPVVDALVLSRRVDSVIVVARSAFTQRASISRAIRLLKNAGVTYSVLANDVETRSQEYTQFYGRYEATAR